MESKTLGSRYELLELVGTGGMAMVYKAKDRMLNRFVAVKILREEFKENEDFIHRFKVESQAAASLSHQNIVQIYDVGEEDGVHYIVMEFLEGETLKKYILSKGGKLSRREAVNFSMQICRALEHAHSKYVVHRDIKPQNMVLTESGKLKVADFGIARAANNNTTVNSGSNMAVGSAHYLSPEQARGGYTDNRSDIYSLGVVMYEMFTGKLPFDADESVSVVMQHLHEEPVRPCDINPDLPLGIEAIILKAMKKEQRLRYANASEILEDLVLVYQNPSIDVSLLNASEDGSGTPLEKKTSPDRSERTAYHKKKKKKKISKLLVALLSMLVVAFAALIFLLYNMIFPNTGKEVEIPDLTGMTFEEASLEAERSSSEKVKFTVIKSRYEFSDREQGTIVSQSPEGGRKIKVTREIEVVISKGPLILELEDYEGKSFDDIEAKLTALGIIVEKEEASNPDYGEGIIFNQNPAEGTQMAEGELVTFYVSEGTKYAHVPNVIGKTWEAAESEIKDADLEVERIEGNSDYDKGKVFRQSIKAGEKVPAGEKIVISVSTGIKESDSTPPADTSSTPDSTTENPENNKAKNVKLTLSNLPKDRETVRIRLVLDGKTYYEKDFPTSSGNATISINTNKTLSLDVYYDGTYITTKEVKY